MPDQKFSLPTPTQFVGEHLPWVLGVVPFALAAVNVLAVSGGDPQVFSYLLQDLGIVALILSVVIPLIPVAILLMLLGWLTERRTIPKGERPEMHYTMLFFVGMGLGGALLTITISWLAVILILAIFIEIDRYFDHRRSLKSKFRYGADVKTATTFPGVFRFAVMVGVLMVQALVAGVNWLPNEVIETKGAPAVSGQVFTSDGQWTIFRDLKNRIHIVRADDVVSRQPCYRDTTFLGKTPSKLISERFSTTPPVVQCLTRVRTI